MFVQPNLATRLAALAPSLTPHESELIFEIAEAFADEPGEMAICLSEQLELVEQRIILEAIHGRSLSFAELARYYGRTTIQN